MCLALLSCAPKGPSVVLSLDEVKPYEGPVTVEVLKGSRVLNKFKTLRSEVSVKVKRGKKSLGRFKGALAFEQPDRFRLRLYDPLGGAGLDALNSGGILQVYVPRNGVIYEGKSPASREDVTYSVRDNGRDYILFALNAANGSSGLHASYDFDHGTLLNKEIGFYRGGERFVRMRFARYAGGVPLLVRVDVRGGYSMWVDLKDPEVDAELPPGLFEPIGRAGLAVLPLENALRGGL